MSRENYIYIERAEVESDFNIIIHFISVLVLLLNVSQHGLEANSELFGVCPE